MTCDPASHRVPSPPGPAGGRARVPRAGGQAGGGFDQAVDWVHLGTLGTRGGELVATASDCRIRDGSFRRRMSIIGCGTSGGLGAAPSRAAVGGAAMYSQSVLAD
jgi:hypothetical protein